MKPTPLATFDDPTACTHAMGTLFLRFVESVALNEPDLANAALTDAQSKFATALAKQKFSRGDTSALLGLIDYARALVSHEKKPQ